LAAMTHHSDTPTITALLLYVLENKRLLLF